MKTYRNKYFIHLCHKVLQFLMDSHIILLRAAWDVNYVYSLDQHCTIHPAGV